VKFCFKLGKTASETHEVLETAFGDNAMGRTQNFECFSRFKLGEISVEDTENSGLTFVCREEEKIRSLRRTVDTTSVSFALSFLPVAK
jgi:hypothetical protein